MMYGSGFNGGDWGSVVVNLLFMGMLVVGIVAAVVLIARRSRPGNSAVDGSRARAILEERLASGAIGNDEFRRREQLLRR